MNSRSNWFTAVFMITALMASAQGARGEEFKELYRGVRAQGMGNAFVGLADDEEAIFLNPAGMAGQRRYGINYAVVGLEASTDIITTAQDGAAALKKLSGDSLNTIMGKDIYAHGQFTPSITISNFGLAVILDDQAAILARNQALPQITVGYQQTNGIQAAWGTSVLGKRARKGEDLRFGIGAKWLYRRGGYRLLSLTQVLNVSKDTLHEIAGSFERGYGFDTGVQYIRSLNNRLTLGWGLAYTDIGDTKFGGTADPIPSNLSTGISATYNMRVAKAILSYDMRHLTQSGDWKKKQHIGGEFALPLLSIYAGVNQAFFTYGVGFDAWLFRVSAVSYAEEQGSYAQQEGERRYLLQLALKVGL